MWNDGWLQVDCFFCDMCFAIWNSCFSYNFSWPTTAIQPGENKITITCVSMLQPWQVASGMMCSHRLVIFIFYPRTWQFFDRQCICCGDGVKLHQGICKKGNNQPVSECHSPNRVMPVTQDNDKQQFSCWSQLLATSWIFLAMLFGFLQQGENQSNN